MKSFAGKVLFLERSDINTDEIIPAKYLTEIDKAALKPHLFEDLDIEGFDPRRDITEETGIVITRDNFGCGSSREHAPWALEMNGIHVVIARGFARIFRQNMFNGGMLAIELDGQTIDQLFSYAGRNIVGRIDLRQNEFILEESGSVLDRVPFSLNEFDDTLVRQGGWIEYAARHY